ncbi:CRISPR-associated helicase Cas3' [uncultured Acidaminococcus sp.]|uniref:CRISPR-associated helicase Cas3' n=1 Tax=uncultured Acidaminococcus sp. TaxID=352152 RepID=UPI0025953939|nr:CRISPR-associated helicase Cas3' [uncultured Acidaminococcus sp.]
MDEGDESKVPKDTAIQYIAHLDPDQVRAPQSLLEHLQNVSKLAGQFAVTPEMKLVAAQCGLYHDIGKYSQEFQKYIRGLKHGRVDHSTAGAQLLQQTGSLTGALEAFCIAGHHAGLSNRGSRFDTANEGTFCGRMKKEVPDFSAYKNELPQPQKFMGFEKVLNEYGTFQRPDCIAANLWLRMLFSCLVDADFLDTEAYMKNGQVQRGQFATIDELAAKFFSLLKAKGFFAPKNNINRKRCEILRRCMDYGKKRPAGIYTLTVPTGGGKTISAFAWAMEQARTYHKKRIIYVIPYTSIIEQTADTLRSFLGNDNIIEHHSQVEYDDTQEALNRKRLASENWDAPVIVTTNVQFFESLFANRTSRCRKLHNMAESVILFDEVQMFPVNFLLPVLQSMEALVRHFSCSLLLCSATQPEFDSSAIPSLKLSPKPVEIMDDLPGLYQFFKRTTMINERLQDYDWIADRISEHPQCLCICLTKEEALQIFQRVRGECTYLSTNLCPSHRQQVIQEMKEKLKNGETCRMVSTSIISVGVDIDFPVVYLEENGVDSLIQGAGRCNREGKNTAAESLVRIFSTEKIQNSRFMRQERQCTQLAEQQYTDITVPDAIKFYFKNLYGAQEEILDERKILGLSAQQSFATIGEKFKLIEDHTKNLFILWDDEAKRIEQQLRAGIFTRELMRKAGKYMVSVWSQTGPQPGLYEQLLNDGLADPLDDQMAILKDLSIYDTKTGLTYKQQEGRGLFL